jgi:hypothetical protein
MNLAEIPKSFSLKGAYSQQPKKKAWRLCAFA